ncbi:hypothetical protein M8J77_013248 [Diaphorina citri]|nr:hypothetical protein M8J77_013248 [Diaphorina citri]
MYRRGKIKEIKDCKVINGENVASQHKVVVTDCWINIIGKKKKRKMGVPKIKWWLLKNPETSELFRRKVMEETRPIEGVNEWWNENSRVIKQVAVNILGKTSGKSPPK